jgi:hypothetical protein
MSTPNTVAVRLAAMNTRTEVESVEQEIARLKAENEAMARKEAMEAFLARRKVEDHMDAPVGTPMTGPDIRGRQPKLAPFMAPASAEARARFSARRAPEATEFDRAKLDIMVERHHILGKKLPRRERG